MQFLLTWPNIIPRKCIYQSLDTAITKNLDISNWGVEDSHQELMKFKFSSVFVAYIQEFAYIYSVKKDVSPCSQNG